MGQPIGHASLSPRRLFQLQGINRINRREASYPFVMMDTRLHTQSRRQVGFTCTGATNQNNVPGLFNKFTSMERIHQRFCHDALSKIEAREIPVSREFGDLQPVVD